MRLLLRFSALLMVGWLAPLAASDASPGPAQAAASRAYFAAVVNREGLLLDAEGRPVAVADVPAYLKQLDLTGIDTIALWISGPETIPAMQRTLAAFAGRFTQIIVKEHAPGEKTGRLAWPDDRADPTRSASGLTRQIVVQRLPDPSTAVPPPVPAALPRVELKLTAGQSAILVGGQRIYFPAGTTVCMPGGNNVNIQGHQNTVQAGPGAIIAVPLNATGEPDNVVIAP